MVSKDNGNENPSAKGSQTSGTRVEVTLPVNQASGLIPPVCPPQVVSPFTQPTIVNPGLFAAMPPMGFPGSAPMPSGPPNIIVTVPPRENKGDSDAEVQNTGKRDREG